MEKLLFCLQNS